MTHAPGPRIPVTWYKIYGKAILVCAVESASLAVALRLEDLLPQGRTVGLEDLKIGLRQAVQEIGAQLVPKAPEFFGSYWVDKFEVANDHGKALLFMLPRPKTAAGGPSGEDASTRVLLVSLILAASTQVVQDPSA